jgi:gluconokinase
MAQIIIVMGVAGVGKSTLGEALAQRLAAPFLEGDQYHPPANVAKMRGGTPLTDEDRWPWLDALGRALGAQARQHGRALGACSALKRAYRDRLASAAGLPIRFICLTGEADLLAERMARRVDHYMPVSLLTSQLATLELPGADEDALLLPAALPAEALVERALAWLADRGPADRPNLPGGGP